MKARVLQSTGSWYQVLTEDNKEIIECRTAGKLRLEDKKITNPVAVGDWVDIEMEKGLETAVIKEIFPRQNYIIRESPRKKRHSHIIAANIDQALLVVTFSKPRTSLGFIDRFLMVAETYHIPTILIFNKQDIYNKKDLRKYHQAIEIYQSMNYHCIATSIINGEGIEDLKAGMHQKTSLIAGHSGVGKSSIINCIDENLNIKTKTISKASQKGKHTTTFATMHPLKTGGFIIDTPGIKTFQPVHIEPEELGQYFRDIRTFASDCRFNNCMHQKEPKCAVKDALENGDIALSRYRNYINLLTDVQATNYWERNV